MTGDRVWGYMGIDLVETYHDWSNEDFQWFSSLGNIINICIELRKTKDKVIREQTFLNNLFHFMPMGYIRMSIIRDENNKPCDYRVTDANEVSSTFFGLPLESYIGSLASEKHPDYLQNLIFWKKYWIVILIGRKMNIFQERNGIHIGLFILPEKMK